MNDQEFLQAFEIGTLTHFPHQAHLRMAWLYLREYGWEVGSAKIRAGIQQFALAHGATRKYHDTLTIFWAKLVESAIKVTPKTDDFHAFLDQHPHLLNGKLVEEFYSQERLFSEEARQGWIAPDLKSLP